jgi:hypothetical protein
MMLHEPPLCVSDTTALFSYLILRAGDRAI